MSDDLKRYREKRNPDKTPEPFTGEASGGEPTFVVQKHAATRLHYDVRFEVDGVMPSWPVPKGPSYDPKAKRLAMHVEDHPLDYQTFEGTIPKGEYGGGAVIVWDRGTYRNITEHKGKTVPMREAIERGRFSVWLDGVKLHGGWTFTRMRQEGSGEPWLMIKRKDEYADPSLDIEVTAPDSVLTGRSIDEVAADTEAATWTRAVSTWQPPMLAQLAKTPTRGDEWVYERKLDGLRCVAVRNGDDVQLWSRNHLSFNARFPEIIDALLALPVDNFVVDGELVAYDDRGTTSFSLLQRRGVETRSVYAVFDVLHLLGRDTTTIPLLQRKELLAKALEPTETIELTEVFEGDGSELLETACADGWEGLIAKRRDSEYCAGRSPDWRKLKCSASQELVIGGWTEPKGARTGFGALLVGYYDGDELRYAGKVGTGFDNDVLSSLHALLLERELPSSPFVDTVRERTAHWTHPDLVANFAFSEWTRDGKLRHGRFEGLRADKDACSVVREAT